MTCGEKGADALVRHPTVMVNAKGEGQINKYFVVSTEF